MMGRWWLCRLGAWTGRATGSQPPRLPSIGLPQPRWISTKSEAEVVDVPCKSSGSIPISLHNLKALAPSTPLLVHLPPFPTSGKYELPAFLKKYPAAIIHYRWAPDDASAERDFQYTPLHWPTPLQDVMTARDWIAKNVMTNSSEGPPYGLVVYSSHLGASIASSMGLTETHQDDPFAVRGLVAYNGIYNWAMFLPDHKINKGSKRAAPATPGMKDVVSAPGAADQSSSFFETLKAQMPGLFHRPANLFDCFASPSLLFQTPGLAVPATFTQPSQLTAAVDRLAMVSSEFDDDFAHALAASNSSKPIRRTSLEFPPAMSTQTIPDTLLLFSKEPSKKKTRTTKPTARPVKSTKPKGHHFHAQALEFVQLMRKSVQRQQTMDVTQLLDPRFNPDEAAKEKIQLYEIGLEDGVQPNAIGQQIITQWLDQRFRVPDDAR